MNEAPRDFDTIQRWMHAVITHPDGAAGGVDSDTARGQIGVTSENVGDVVTPSSTLTSIQRLEVYCNAYYARLVECLGSEFPATSAALGEETFASFCYGYLQAYPSTSYTLADLGSRFPQYLRETRPEDVPAPGWPDFLIDLATLERMYAEVFDGRGVEDEELFSAEDLQELSPEQWAGAKLVPVPCLRLIELRYPCHEYASSVRQGESPEFPDPEPTLLAVTRREYIVRRAGLTRPQFVLLEKLVDGMPIAQAIEETADLADLGEEEFAQALRKWFQRWATARYFRKIEVA